MMKAFGSRGYPLLIQISGHRVAARSCKTFQCSNPVTCWSHFHQSQQRRIVQPYLLADIGEGITECQIVSWSVKPGDQVEQFDPICEVSSDKATVEITSRFDGTIKKLLYDEGEVAVVGEPILTLDVPGDDTSGGLDLAESTLEQAPPDAQAEKLVEALPKSKITVGEASPKSEAPVTPAVRHMLKSANLDINEVKGSGKNGRITEHDVQCHVSASEATNMPKIGTSGDQVVAFTPTEKAMFKSMTESLKIPHFLFTHTIDFTGVNNLRRDLNANASTAESSSSAKLTPVSFVMKAISQALIQFPKINSHLDTSDLDSPRLVQKVEHNFGLAVDTPKGLLVPVVQGVEKRTLKSLAAEIQRLGELARTGRLSPADFQGATFIVSNVGNIGGNTVSPVILAPMVGIVGMSRLREVPVFREDEIVKQEQMILSWSADHRVIDGATIAKAASVVEGWLQDVGRVKKYVEERS